MAMVQTVAKSRERAVASAMMVFAASMIGIGGGPVIVGYLSDAFLALEYANPLRFALLSTTFVPVVACLFLWLAGRTVLDDAKTATLSGN